MKIKKIISAITALSVFMTPIIASSCGNTTKKQNAQSNKVILATAQGKNWPLMVALQPLVNQYNEMHKNDKDFMPVELWFSDKTKTISQLTLAQNTATEIQQNSKNVPNILLADQAGAYIINAQNKLLNVENNGFSASFNDKILALHNTLPGQNKKMLYSIPFDIEDDSAVSYNLDLMAVIFDIIKKAGGKIDETMELYKKAEAAKTTGSEIPQNSLFKYLVPNDSNTLNQMNINAKTFQTLEGIRQFVTTFYKNVHVDWNKIPSSVTATNGSIMSIDYSADVFLKDSQSKDYQNQYWNIETTNDPNEPTKVSFDNFLKENSSQSTKFINLWNAWTANLGKPQVNVTSDKNQISFQSIVFDNLGKGDWSPYKIGSYRTAIAFMPSIGINGTRWNPSGQDKAYYTDTIMLPQISLANDNATPVYAEGGSSLVPIKTSAERDKATTKFLNWLYTGSTKDANGNNLPNWKYLAINAGYIMPLSNVVTQDNLNALKAERDSLLSDWEKQYQQYKGKASLTDEEKTQLQTIYNNLLKKANYLTAAITAMTSMLNYMDGNGNVKILNQPNDKLSKQFSSYISGDLVASSTIKQNTDKTYSYELTNSGKTEWQSIKDKLQNN